MPYFEYQSRHDSRHLIELFDKTFSSTYATRLVGGGAEPEYLPATGTDDVNRVIFTRDYFASALHEVAHWCVAGRERRKKQDYGYWYQPDGRTADEQKAFERVEVRPQALEWLFSEAADWRFRVSADNLTQDAGPSDAFKDAIHAQVRRFCEEGVSARVGAFLEALRRFYHSAAHLDELLDPERFPRRRLS